MPLPRAEGSAQATVAARLRQAEGRRRGGLFAWATAGTGVARAAGWILLATFTLGPVVLVALASVLPEAGLLTFPPAWFQYGFTLDNYRYIFTGDIPSAFVVKGALRSMVSQEVRTVPRAMFNSAVVALGVTLLGLGLGALAAAAYSRLRFPGRTGTFWFLMLSRLLPPVAIAVPYYAILQQLGLINTRLGLLLIYTALTLPFSVLLLTLFFRGVPQEIEEAAMVDGCSRLEALWRVTLPLSLPGLVGTGLFSFMMAYNEFLFGLLTLTSREMKTLPVVLAGISTNPDVSWGLLNAGVFLGVLPMLVLALPVWRFMVRGLVEGYH